MSQSLEAEAFDFELTNISVMLSLDYSDLIYTNQKKTRFRSCSKQLRYMSVQVIHFNVYSMEKVSFSLFPLTCENGVQLTLII